MARLTSYEPKYHAPWAWSLAIEGLDIKEIASRMKISKRTLERWRIQYPEMKEALDVGRECADSKVKESLYKRAIGYTADESKQIFEYDSNGMPRPVKLEVYKKHIPGDVGASAMWLKNRAGWQDNPNKQGAGGKTFPDMVVETWKEIERKAKESNQNGLTKSD